MCVKQQEVFFINRRVEPNNVNKDLVNDKIKFKEVLVINSDGEQLGVKTRNEALKIAYEQDLDLLCVAPKAQPPVCKIVNYGKYRFEQQKKAKEAKKKQQVIETKNLRLSPVIDKHDFETKQKQVAKWVEGGMKVKVDMKFKGRFIMNADYGKRTMEEFINGLNEVVNVEKKPILEGNTLSCVLGPKKK